MIVTQGLRLWRLCAVCCAELLQLYPTLQRYGPRSARLLCPRDSPGKNTGVGYPALLQGIFLIHGLYPLLLHCRQILYPWARGKTSSFPITGFKDIQKESCGFPSICLFCNLMSHHIKEKTSGKCSFTKLAKYKLQRRQKY